MKPLLNEMSITVAAVRDDSEVAVALVLDKYANDDSFPHGSIYRVTAERATDTDLYSIAFVGLTYSDRGGGEVVGVGDEGAVRVFTADGVLEERIEGVRGPLRDVSAIDGEVYACGTNRQVYRRGQEGAWQDVGPGEAFKEELGRNHLEQIVGNSATELYAAGRSGVIWWFDGHAWTAVRTDTKLSFLCATCGADGTVYLGGQCGVVATGRRGEFTVHTPEPPLDDIWGIAELDERIYLASLRALMTWTVDEGHQVVAPAMERAQTFYNLGRGPTTLWSLGSKDVLRFDGQAWERLDEVPVK